MDYMLYENYGERIRKFFEHIREVNTDPELKLQILKAILCADDFQKEVREFADISRSVISMISDTEIEDSVEQFNKGASIIQELLRGFKLNIAAKSMEIEKYKSVLTVVERENKDILDNINRLKSLVAEFGESVEVANLAVSLSELEGHYRNNERFYKATERYYKPTVVPKDPSQRPTIADFLTEEQMRQAGSAKGTARRK